MMLTAVDDIKLYSSLHSPSIDYQALLLARLHTISKQISYYFIPFHPEQFTMSTATKNIDISALTLIQADAGAFLIRDDVDEEKQAIFDALYASKKYWTSFTDEEKARKIENMNWSTKKSAGFWGMVEQGLILETGRPAVICLVCEQVYAHTYLNGTSTVRSHLNRQFHIAKAKELLYGDAKSKLDVDHVELVKILRLTGSAGVMVSTRQCGSAVLGAKFKLLTYLVI
jgi:hypothetical protein